MKCNYRKYKNKKKKPKKKPQTMVVQAINVFRPDPFGPKACLGRLKETWREEGRVYWIQSTGMPFHTWGVWQHCCNWSQDEKNLINFLLVWIILKYWAPESTRNWDACWLVNSEASVIKFGMSRIPTKMKHERKRKWKIVSNEDEEITNKK